MADAENNPKIGGIETELGVPIPGVILPPEQWTQTAVRRLPADGKLDFEQLFSRRALLVLDIGCGNGRFIVSSAVRRPDVDHIGIDILPVVIRYATRRARQRGLSNARLAVCGGMEFLQCYVEPGLLAEIHIYHPQPYQDSADRRLRLLTPGFLLQVHKSLAAGGQLFLQSDNRAYWEYLQSIVGQVMHWHERHEPWSEDPLGRSRREIIARNQGLPIFRAIAKRRDDLDEQSVKIIVDSLPEPEFQATAKKNRTGWTRRKGRKKG